MANGKKFDEETKARVVHLILGRVPEVLGPAGARKPSRRERSQGQRSASLRGHSIRNLIESVMPLWRYLPNTRMP
jgi:hypothetical protein